jgi:hypothetical protein
MMLGDGNAQFWQNHKPGLRSAMGVLQVVEDKYYP